MKTSTTLLSASESKLVDVVPDRFARDDLSGFRGKQFQQGILAPAEFDALTRAADNALGGIDLHIGDLDHRRFCFVLPSNQRPHACQQFLKHKRLGEIIIRTQVQSLDAIFGRILGGEDQHVRIRVLASQFFSECSIHPPLAASGQGRSRHTFPRWHTKALLRHRRCRPPQKPASRRPVATDLRMSGKSSIKSTRM